MPVMAVRPNPMNYGSSRCKRFLSCLQRPVVCGEREREGNRKKEREREIWVYAVPSRNPSSFLYPSSLLSVCILSGEKQSLLPITFGQKYYFTHHTFEISHEYVTYICTKEWLPSTLILFKKTAGNWIFLEEHFFFFQLDGGVCVKWNHDTFYISPPFLFITCWWFWK